jgi:hypothetical protein
MYIRLRRIMKQYNDHWPMEMEQFTKNVFLGFVWTVSVFLHRYPAVRQLFLFFLRTPFE